MTFNCFDKIEKRVIVETETPSFCLNNIKENNERCLRYYNSICESSSVGCVFTCPYGLCSFKTDGRIYTSLIVYGYANYQKLIPNLKRNKQPVNSFSCYTYSQITRIIEEYESIENEIEIRRMTIHDIKNAIQHFSDLVDEVKNNESLRRITESTNELFSAIEGYGLIKYRLAYHDKLLNYTQDGYPSITEINFYQVLTKLSKMLQYRGKKKGVSIKFEGNCFDKIHANNDLYLMYYILLENALKYSKEDTEVVVDFTNKSINCLIICIKNECASLDGYEIGRVFEKGFRSDFAMKTSRGSGLGLTLAKRIADASSVELECLYEYVNEFEGYFIAKCTHIIQ